MGTDHCRMNSNTNTNNIKNSGTKGTFGAYNYDKKDETPPKKQE